MGAQLRIYRRRVRTIGSTKKITKAMELIATSRIAKAQARMKAARPYVVELTRALAALGKNASLSHPMLTGVDSPQRTGILVITSDRGLAGGYSANAIKRANELTRAAARRRPRGRPLRHRPQGCRVLPVPAHRPGRIVDRVLRATDVRRRARCHRGGDRGSVRDERGSVARSKHGIDELYVVYTHFESMVTQSPTAEQVAPVKAAGDPAEADDADDSQALYEFEPEAEQFIDSLLPRYISARLFSALLEAGGVGVGCSKAGNEVGQRQRRGADPHLHSAGEPGPSGRDHSGDQRDRRRRRRPRRNRK